MFWSEHSFAACSTTYVEYSTLHRKSAFLHRIKICGELRLGNNVRHDSVSISRSRSIENAV